MDTPDPQLDVLDHLIATSTDPRLVAQARKWRNRITLPMADILAKVPGESVPDKYRRLGVPRQTWFSWVNGKARPNRKTAAKLARLTGYSRFEIMGY